MAMTSSERTANPQRRRTERCPPIMLFALLGPLAGCPPAGTDRLPPAPPAPRHHTLALSQSETLEITTEGRRYESSTRWVVVRNGAIVTQGTIDGPLSIEQAVLLQGNRVALLGRADDSRLRLWLASHDEFREVEPLPDAEFRAVASVRGELVSALNMVGGVRLAKLENLDTWASLGPIPVPVLAMTHTRRGLLVVGTDHYAWGTGVEESADLHWSYPALWPHPLTRPPRLVSGDDWLLVEGGQDYLLGPHRGLLESSFALLGELSLPECEVLVPAGHLSVWCRDIGQTRLIDLVSGEAISVPLEASASSFRGSPARTDESHIQGVCGRGSSCTLGVGGVTEPRRFPFEVVDEPSSLLRCQSQCSDFLPCEDECAHAWTRMARGSVTALAEDGQRRRVRIDHGFEIHTAEIMRGTSWRVMGHITTVQPCGPDCATRPAEVAFEEAAAFCNALSRTRGLPTCYECDGWICRDVPQYEDDIATCPGYRLPTSAEWAYAGSHGGGDVRTPWTHDAPRDRPARAGLRPVRTLKLP